MLTDETDPKALLRAVSHSGFVGEEPRLSHAKIDELARLIRPALAPYGSETFAHAVQRIFAVTVVNVAALQHGAGPQPARVKKALKAFVITLEKSAAAIDGLDPIIEALIEDRFAERRARQPAPNMNPSGMPGSGISAKTSVVIWKRTVLELLDTVLAEAERLEIKTVKGASGVAYRQMVVALCALIYDLTKEIPKRQVTNDRKDGKQGSADEYWFLELCRLFAAEVHREAAIHLQKQLREDAMRRGVEPLIPAEASDLLDKQADRKSITVKGRMFRNMDQHPPSLTAIVREELAALEKEKLARS